MAKFVDPRSNPDPKASTPPPRTTADPDELAELHRLCREGRLYDVERWIRAGKPLQMAADTLPPRRSRPTTALGITLDEVKPGDPWVKWELLALVAEEELWPEEQYHRLSGMVLFRPRTHYQTSAPGPHMHLSVNPKALWPLGPSLHEVFSGGKRFHYDHQSNTWSSTRTRRPER